MTTEANLLCEDSNQALKFAPYYVRTNHHKANVLHKQFRIEFRLAFTNLMKAMKYFRNQDYAEYTYSKKPDQNQPMPSSMFNKKPIYLRDLEHSQNKIYKDFILEVTIVEPPFKIQAIFICVKDDKGYQERIEIYHNINSKAMYKNYSVGTRIAIVNPYAKIGMDGKPLIRVDNSTNIIFLEPVSICHYCSSDLHSNFILCECKLAKYCCVECQKKDKEFHSLLCN